MAIVSDSFTGGRNAAWADEGTGFKYDTNEMSCGGTTSISLWYDGGAGARANDQYVQCKIVTRSTVSGEGPGPAARMTTDGSGNYTYGYFVHCNTTNTTLYESSSGGAYQSKGTGSAVSAGDVVRLICNGSVIQVVNVTTATTLVSANDSTITSGFSGLRGYGTGRVDNWEAGNYSDLSGAISISATSSTGIQYWTGALHSAGIEKTLPVSLGQINALGSTTTSAYGKQADILLGLSNAEGFTPSIAKAVTILLGETRAQGFAAQNVAIIRTFLGLLGELRALGFTVSSEPAQTANIGIGSANFTGLAAANIGIVAPASTITAVGLLRETQAVGFIGQVIRVVFPMTGTAHFDGYGAQALEFIKVISGPDIGEIRAEGIAATALIGQIRNYTISLGEVGFYALQQALTIQRTLDILVGQTNYTGIEPHLAIIRGGEINLGATVGVVTLEGLINATANIQRTAFGEVGLANAEGFGAAAPAGQLSVQSVLGEMYASGFVPLVSFNRYFAQLGQMYASGFAPDITYGLWRPIKRRLTTWASI